MQRAEGQGHYSASVEGRSKSSKLAPCFSALLLFIELSCFQPGVNRHLKVSPKATPEKLAKATRKDTQSTDATKEPLCVPLLRDLPEGQLWGLEIKSLKVTELAG